MATASFDHEAQTEMISVEAFAEKSAAWLEENLERRTDDSTTAPEPNYAIFHNRTHDEERVLIDAARAWQGRRVDAGFGAITWGPE